MERIEKKGYWKSLYMRIKVNHEAKEWLNGKRKGNFLCYKYKYKRNYNYNYNYNHNQLLYLYKI